MPISHRSVCFGGATVRTSVEERWTDMKNFVWSLVAGLSLSLSVVACGGAQEPKKTPSSSTAECSQQATPAHDKVNEAIAANQDCTTDADCVSIAVATSCFDACTTSVTTSSQAAVEQAMKTASDVECKAFVDAGCKVIAPPCAPPKPAACRSNRCE